MHTTASSPLLIIGASWVGDMLMAQSLLKVLKQQQPELEIDVLAPQWSAGLLQRMPEVRHAIGVDLAHGNLAWTHRRQIGQDLRQANYQQAIVLPNSWKSALIPFWANIPRRTGFFGEWRFGLLNDWRTKNKQTLPRTVDQFVSLAFDAQHPYAQDLRNATWIPYPQLTAQPADNLLPHLKLDYQAKKPLLILCAGAEYGEAKRWLAEHFAAVARQKLAENWQVWLIGSTKDAAMSQQIIELAGGGVNLCGRTQLADAVDLMALATQIISNDSGLMHVAAALQKPLIAIFGSSSPQMTPPLTDKAQILWLNLPCSPCFKRQCPLKHLNCLKQITPEMVLAKF